VHSDREIVSYAPEELVHRGCYRTTAERVRQLAHALQSLGVRPGDRVATFACSTHRHLEVFFAVSGIGAVCQTVNPRLHPDQVAWILNHTADALMFVDLAFFSQAEVPLRLVQTSFFFPDIEASPSVVPQPEINGVASPSKIRSRQLLGNSGRATETCSDDKRRAAWYGLVRAGGACRFPVQGLGASAAGARQGGPG
jgi:hypothetical protein